MIGRTDEELLGSQADQLTEVKKRVLNTGIGERTEFEIPGDGRTYFYDTTVDPLKDQSGKVTGVICTAVDITERRRVEKELRESERKFKTMAENAPDAIMRFDTNLRVLYLNPNNLSVTGRRLEEFLGRTNEEMGMPEELCKLWNGMFERARVTGQVQRAEFDFNAVNGLRMFSLSIVPEYSEDGSLASFMGISRDITDRNRAEEQLRSSVEELRRLNEKLAVSEEELAASNDELKMSKAELMGYSSKLEQMVGERTHEIEGVRKSLEESARYTRSLIEASLDPLVAISAEGRITDVNNAAVAATGVPKNQMIGSEFASYFTEPEKAREGRRRAFQEGFVKDYPLTLRHASGSTIEVLYNAALYRDSSGNPAGIFAAARDVTELRRMQERLRVAEQVEAVDRLSGMVAHDIRSPLTTAYQAIQVAEVSPEKAEVMLSMARKNIGRAIEMIEELRENTRTVAPMLQSVNLGALIEDVVREMQVPEGISVQTSIDQDVLAVKVDPSLIRRLLENLVRNAVEAMPDGGSLRLSATRSGGDVLLTVADTGIGISEEAMSRIFTPFYTSKPKGLGLGLSFCKRVVEAHGGTISFDSRRGESTTFSIRLPC